MISDFCHEVAENCTLLGYYAPSSGCLLSFYAVSSGTTHCLINQTIAVLLLGVSFKYSERFYIQQPFGPRVAGSTSLYCNSFQ